jgi:hypothetical protein
MSDDAIAAICFTVLILAGMALFYFYGGCAL